MQASIEIPGFEELHCKLKRRMRLSGRSISTLKNYTRHLAQMVLHCRCLPNALSIEEVDYYLFFLQQQHKTPSDSYFKHTIFG